MIALSGLGCSRTPSREMLRCLSRVVPSAAIVQALERTGACERRVRKLPSPLVVHLVIALGLLADVASRQVLGFLLPKGTKLPTKKSVSRARYRIGPRPLMELFRSLAAPLATRETIPGAFYRALHLFCLDAMKMDVPDTPENARIFGRPKASRGQTAFPQVKIIGWLEAGTRMLTDLLARPCRRHEHAAGLALIDRQAAPGQLILADRAFFSYAIPKRILGRGADFLIRAKSNAILKPLKILPDGSYLAKMYPTWGERRRDRKGLVVRVIDYQVGASEVIRLVTSLLDCELDPAQALAALYHERWEIETVYDEVKTHQQGRPNGHPTPIRSQLPRGVIQEVYGLALAHRAVRIAMAAGAVREGIDPDRLSFKNALVIVRRYLPELAATKPRTLSPL